jgi:uncharacterized protein YjiS (DUF1127 family)
VYLIDTDGAPSSGPKPKRMAADTAARGSHRPHALALTIQKSAKIMSTTVTDKSGLEPTWTGELLARSPGRSLFNDFREAIAGCVAYRALRRAEAELMALDNRTLKDIGLDRSEIRSVLMDGARKHRSGGPTTSVHRS